MNPGARLTGRGLVAILAASLAPASASAGCKVFSYDDVEESTWFGAPLLAFKAIPVGGALLVDPQDDAVVGIQEVAPDGSFGSALDVTFEPIADAAAVTRVRPNASLAVGREYRVVRSLRTGDTEPDGGPAVQFSVTTHDDTPPPDVEVLHARYRTNDGCGTHLDLAVAPWADGQIVQEIQTAWDPEFADRETASLLSRDALALPVGGGAPWLRARTWIPSGEHGEWSDPLRIAGCACGTANRTPTGTPLAVALVLPWLLARRGKGAQAT